MRALPDFYIGGTWPNPKDRNHDVPSTKSYEYKERTESTLMKLIFCINWSKQNQKEDKGLFLAKLEFCYQSLSYLKLSVDGFPNLRKQITYYA